MWMLAQVNYNTLYKTVGVLSHNDMLGTNNLVPRLFPSPVFDCLQYANTGGKAWEIWSRAVMSGRQKVDTRGAVPNKES